MKIAVEGCCHGELEKIYETLEYLQKKENLTVDLLLCCGDFQAVRNRLDLSCMATPPKYRIMQTFYKYYSGEKKAPVLTVFIGGNHEASNHLWELPYGGWVAPNIYYLGYSGVVNFGGFRIAGLSGIFKGHDYNLGHFEKPPYNDSTLRSAYHIRSFDIFKFKLLSNPIDIFMSHDWPLGVYHRGNLERLLRFKGFLRNDIESNSLGSPPAGELLALLQPTYWFSAHLHVKFPALVPHECQDGMKFTKFLALDKCLPRREFLQVVDVGPAKGPLELSFDPEWLVVTKLTDGLSNTTPTHTVLPHIEEEIARFKPNDLAIEEVIKMFNNQLKIPENFIITTAPHDPADPKTKRIGPVMPVFNPQTEHFCKILGIQNPCFSEQEVHMRSANPEEISLSDEDGDEADSSPQKGNPDEIALANDEDDNDDENANTWNNSGGDHNNITHKYENKDSVHEEHCRQPKPRNRSLLTLPKPVNFNAGADTDDSLGNVADISIPETGASENPETNDVSDSSPTKKPNRKVMKLVRRNQALYTSHEDEETD